MSDPYNTPPRNPPGTNPPRHVPPAGSNTPFIAGGIAIAIALAVGLWAMNHRSTPTTAANPPAVTAAPAPATRPAEETTGRTVQPPTPGQALDPVAPAR